MIKKTRKKLIKKYSPTIITLGRVLLRISKWQSSPFLPIRWIGIIIISPIYFLLRDNYYKLLILSVKAPLLPRRRISRGAPKFFLLKALTGDRSTTVDKYRVLLDQQTFSPDSCFEWARRFMEIGRLDLARAGFLDLINRAPAKWPITNQLEANRFAGVVCFLMGKNNEANHYWMQAGKIRRALFKPQTPKTYRILGSGWFAAIGHIAMLDYYLKFKQLYAEENLRIVAPWDVEGFSGRDLLLEFAKKGIVVIHPKELKSDYNDWAKKNGALLWSQLSPEEELALVDDFWEYDFPDREILGYAHAAARIQKDWERAGHAPLFALSSLETQWVEDYLMNLGVPKGAWYVCLHVREAGFHKQWNTLYPTMRDADIYDYQDAIKEIVNAGGWVLRMGDPTMKPLPPMQNVVDYASSHLKTPMADILIPAGCRFYLGTNSGYATICTIYNVPCALTNWVPIGWPLWPHQDLMIHKLFREKDTGRYLTLEEIFKRELAFIQNWDDLPADIELIANTPEEIAQVTLEMLLQTNNSKNILNSAAPVAVQNSYIQIAKNYGAFTGSRLGKSFIEAHPDVFSFFNEEFTETIFHKPPSEIFKQPEVI